MDASVPPIPPAAARALGRPSFPRWLPWLNIVVGVLSLLWMIPSWFIINTMFADTPIEVRPPAAMVYLLTAIPGVAGVALLVAGACLMRRRGYLLCMLASATTLFGGPMLIVGILNVVHLLRPQVRAQFGRND